MQGYVSILIHELSTGAVYLVSNIKIEIYVNLLCTNWIKGHLSFGTN